MSAHLSSPRSSHPLKSLIKGVFYLLVTVLIVFILLVVFLPSLLSTDFAKQKIIASLSGSLHRPVSVSSFSFSWTKGVAVSGLSIENNDQSPLLSLKDLTLKVALPPLARRKIVVEALIIDGIEVIITRDPEGKTSINDLLGPPAETAPKKEAAPPSRLPALLLDAHVKNASLTFVDQRLATTTRISNVAVDITITSLTEPINLLLKGTVALDDNPPEPVEVIGTALVAPDGTFDLQKVRGNLELTASFGQVKAYLDLAQFNRPEEATGASLSCFIDIQKLMRLGAAIIGLPPGFSIKGQLKSNLEARGNLQTQVAVKGETSITDLIAVGGPFRDAPFKQARIDFLQDIALNFAGDAINIQTFTLKSTFIDLTASGKISGFRADPAVNLRLSATGDLHNITRLLANVAPLPPDLNVKGTINTVMSSEGNLASLAVKGKTELNDFKIDTALLQGVPLSEKSVIISHDLVLNVPQRRCSISSFSLTGESVRADLKGTLAETDDVDITIRLSTDFRNLKRQLGGILPASFPTAGELESNMNLTGTVKQSLSLTGNHTLDNITVTLPPLEKDPPSSPVMLAFPRFKLFHTTIYYPENDAVVLKECKANAEFFALETSGDLSDISSNPRLKSDVSVFLDLGKTQAILGALLPKGLSAQGQGTFKFTGEGSLKAPEDSHPLSTWNGNGAMSLGAITYEGLGSLKDFQSTELSLAKGLLKFTFTCLLNDGPAEFKGSCDFNTAKPNMKIDLKGKDMLVSQDIHLLGYVVPILIMSSGGTLSGKGNFSLQAAWEGFDWDAEIGKTITGKGNVSLREGTLRSDYVLSQILRTLGQAETLQFEEILTGFRLADEKIYNDDIQVNGKELTFGLKGWTSLVYDPAHKGNPMEYTVTGKALAKSLGKDAQAILSVLGGGEQTIPIGIGGTVQKPRVSIKTAQPKDLLRELLAPTR
ncbi:MAG: AsmA family protein [Deltaproteobacteria bacterium]|nr:AsmA family protein [Deltaproteobacteria bacterium]